jgi:hypothetical protein
MRGLEELTHGIRNLETQMVLLGNLTELTAERKKAAADKLILAVNELGWGDALASMLNYSTKNTVKILDAHDTLKHYKTTLDSYNKKMGEMRNRAVEMIHEHLDSTDEPLYAALHDLKQEAWEMRLATRNYNVLLDAARKHGDGIDPGQLATGDVLKAQEYFGRGNDLDILVDLREAIKDVDHKLWAYEMRMGETARQISEMRINPDLHLNLSFIEVPESEFFSMKYRYTDYFAAKDYPQDIYDVRSVQKAMTELDDAIGKHYASATGNMNKYIAHVYAQCSGRPMPDLSKIRPELRQLERAAFGK